MRFKKLLWMFDEKKVKAKKAGRGGIIIIQNKKEAKVLYNFVAKQADSTIIELGRKYGGSTAVICASLQEHEDAGHLYSLDLTEVHKKQAHQFMARMKLSNYVTFIKANTQEVPKGYDFSNIGLVFFDASHDYKGLMKELTSWYPLIKKGGYLLIHDYGMEKHTGIKMAVDKFSAAKRLTKLDQIGRTILFIK